MAHDRTRNLDRECDEQDRTAPLHTQTADFRNQLIAGANLRRWAERDKQEGRG